MKHTVCTAKPIAKLRANYRSIAPRSLPDGKTKLIFEIHRSALKGRCLTLSEPAFFWVSHGPGGGAIRPPLVSLP